MSSLLYNSPAAETFFQRKKDLIAFFEEGLAAAEKVVFTFEEPFVPFVKERIATLITIADIDIQQLRLLDESFGVLSMDEGVSQAVPSIPNTQAQSRAVSVGSHKHFDPRRSNANSCQASMLDFEAQRSPGRMLRLSA